MKWVIRLALAGLAIGLVVAFAIPMQWESRALVVFKDRAAHGAPSPGERFLIADVNVRSRTGLSRLIQDPKLDLYPEQRKHSPIDDVIEQMRGADLHIRLLYANPQAATVEIRFRYRDRLKAQSVVQAIITRFEEEDQWQSRVIASAAMQKLEVLEKQVALIEKSRGKVAPYAPQADTARIVRVNVIDAPSLPQTPVLPNRAVIAFFGMSAGALAGVFISRSRK